MNRIYQGRINKVEISGDDGWREREDWADLLRDHHALFQDAINYYIAAFLGMANSEENPLTKVRERSTETCENGEASPNRIWTDFRRRGVNRPGLRDSLERTIPVGKRDPTPEDYFKAILSGNGAGKDVLDLAARELLEETQSGKTAIQQRGREMFPRFCDPCYGGSFPYSISQLAKRAGEQRLRTDLHDLEPMQLRDFADEVNLGWIANLEQKEKPRRGAEARKRLDEAVEYFLRAFDNPDGNKPGSNVRKFLVDEPRRKEELRSIADDIDKMSDEDTPPIPRNRKANLDKTGALLLFKHFPRQFTWDLLKIVYPISNKKEEEEKDCPFFEFDDDPIKLARGGRGYVFPAFTAFRRFGGKGGGEPAWKEFDIAAFKEALKALHQIEAKEKERKEERRMLENRLACMDNESDWKSHAEQEDDAPPVLAGDPRIERLERILSDDLVRSYEMADGEDRKYGLSPRTIRGFDRLRERWRRTVKPGTASLREKLCRQLKEYQQENADSIGSALLFEELTKAENWIVWQEQSPETMEAWREKAKLRSGLDFADNPLKALSEKYRMEREIERLQEPVRLTPADPDHSARHYWFSDDRSFKRNGYGHQPDGRTVVVSIAVKEDSGFTERKARLHYSAPRLARDGLHKSEGRKLADAPYLQPMMEGLGCTDAIKQTGNHAVSLMPARDDRRGGRRFLLNFAPDIDTTELIEKLGKHDRWKGQFAGPRDKNLYLRWPSVVDVAKTKPPSNGWWWERDDGGFTCLSVDLGQRTAGAFVVLEASANAQDQGKRSRVIGTTGDGDSKKEWRASVTARGVLRLPGEDRRVPKDGGWTREPSGKKGRKSSDAEREEARKICKELGIDPEEFGLGDTGVRLSFPEANDRLLRAFGRAKWRLQRLQSLSWRLTDDDHGARAAAEVADSEELRHLLEIAEGETPEKMASAIPPKLAGMRSSLPRMLERIADRVLPLRDGRWEWSCHQESPGSHILRRDRGAPRKRKKIMGQRGLSFRRIEQLEALRRHAQGLNRALTHVPGEKPVHGRAARGEEWPDPCPEILEKLDRAKEQRINQTAHMILAEALGVRLRAPRKPEDMRIENDIHGEYERFRAPVDFIVLEDLARYRASQGRARRENTRLMQWSHRAVLGKLKELAELYGIPVVETNAAYSSLFCSRTGVVGFRAVELTPSRGQDRYWQEKLNKGEKEKLKQIRDLFHTLGRINAGREKAGKPPRTLLAPLEGGPIFVPLDETAPPAPPMQADINAAANLALRAVASPDRLDLHPLIRTENDGETVRPRRESNREKARWRDRSDEAGKICPRDGRLSDTVAKQRRPNFFLDRGKVAEFDRGGIDGIEDRVASASGLFGSVKCRQWKAVKRLNDGKIAKWDNEDGLDGEVEKWGISRRKPTS